MSQQFKVGDKVVANMDDEITCKNATLSSIDSWTQPYREFLEGAVGTVEQVNTANNTIKVNVSGADHPFIVEPRELRMYAPTVFFEGEKVILARPKASTGHCLEEGWIGYVVDDGKDCDYKVIGASEGKGYTTYWFDNDELEPLAGKDKVKPTIVDLIGQCDLSAPVPEDPWEEKKVSALDKQVSGNHYKDCGIQPIEYIHANGLSYLEGNVIKYTTRHSKKNGKADIEKAIHYLELILEMEYKDK